jgi:hypothetical protein
LLPGQRKNCPWAGLGSPGSNLKKDRHFKCRIWSISNCVRALLDRTSRTYAEVVEMKWAALASRTSAKELKKSQNTSGKRGQFLKTIGIEFLQGSILHWRKGPSQPCNLSEFKRDGDLLFGGRAFPVSEKSLFELFEEHQELFPAKSYTVDSSVPHAVFEMFVDSLKI